MSRRSKRIKAAGPAILVLMVLAVAGCQEAVTEKAPEFLQKSDQPPPVVYCNDYTGHIPGSKPFIFGGTCCCTPTPELMDAYHRDGFLLDWDYARLRDYYASLGIKTLHDHRDCNNQCQWGPHILQGGKCMVPPTPGTTHYEEIITGRFEIPEKKPKNEKLED